VFLLAALRTADITGGKFSCAVQREEVISLEKLESFEAFSPLKFGEYLFKYRADEPRIKFI
jgi:hypothetical protein